MKFQRETQKPAEVISLNMLFFFTSSALHNREKAFFFSPPVSCLSLSQTHFNPVHKRVW